MIHVKIAQLAKATVEFSFENNITLAELKEVAGLTSDAGVFTISGNTVCDGHVLKGGEVVCIGKRMKGNTDPVEVYFVRLGGSTLSTSVESGATLGDAINALSAEDKSAFYKEDGALAYELRHYYSGGTIAELNTVITGPGPVKFTCAKRMKGNDVK